MRLKLKKLLACICCAAFIFPVLTTSVSSEDTGEPEIEETAEEEEEEAADPDAVPRTEDEAMALMELVAENDNMALYLNEDEAAIALEDKNTGEIWWSNPINADTSIGKRAQIQELKAGMTLIYGEISRRRNTTANSVARGRVRYKKIENGIEATYTFAVAKITIPVTYTLESDHLKLHVDNTAITEEDYDKITTNLAFMTTFGAADDTEEGYFVIPDGSGAVINFNNQKTSYRIYSGDVYGRNITPIETTAPSVVQNVFLPMYGIVKGNSGMMVVADKGDTCASVNAYVSGQNSTSYNSCYFDFNIRTSDEYLMGGDANPLRVFEKRGILVPEIEVRYYPVSNPEKTQIDYVDIAGKYRDYLTTDYGVSQSEAVNNSPLYIDLFGGVVKTEPILGIPVQMAYEATSFDEAADILEKLKTLGVDDMVVNYNDWTSANIKQKVADKAKPAPILGGKKAFGRLNDYAKANNISIYPAVDNLTFKSGSGYFTVTDTAIRVSNAYSRQIMYDLAHGIENQFYDPLSLLSPSKYEKIFNNLSKTYSKEGITNISLGSWSSKIYGDYGRKAVSREMAKDYIRSGYEKLNTEVGSILADSAHAYVLPYVDHITNVPLSSSKFDLFDYEIPFYQIVMHGIKPYSTTPVNGDAQVAEIILRGIASGSNMQFDFVAEEAIELKDTLYDALFYANNDYWIEDAAGCAKFADDILGDVSGQIITDYNILSDTTIETVYENGTKTVADLDALTVTKNGTVYNLSDYVGKGVIGG